MEASKSHALREKDERKRLEANKEATDVTSLYEPFQKETEKVGEAGHRTEIVDLSQNKLGDLGIDFTVDE